MFILKPLKSSHFTKDALETIEEVVQDSRLVDKGIRELKKLSINVPSFDPERRKFLKHVAVLAGLIASGQLLRGMANAQEPVQFQGKTYSGWEAWLMSQDLIRGPSLLMYSSTRLPSDFYHHTNLQYTEGGVDYDVGIGTPITPTANSYSSWVDRADRTGGIVAHLMHRSPYRRTIYAHLSNVADIIYEGKSVSRGGRPFIDNELDKLNIIAFSGATGIGPGGGGQTPHLHFGVSATENNIMYKLDPFTLGIDAEKPLDEYVGSKGRQRAARPVYWDTKTELPLRPNRVGEKKVYLQNSLDTLDKRIGESDLDNSTKEEILKRRNNPIELRDYLGYRVLEKKKDKDGNERYEFMPGSLMYALMLEFCSRASKQEFIAMLPFIFPPLKPIYQKANPGVKF